MLQTVFSPLTNNDPFADMRRIQSAMNRLFDGARALGQSATDPPVNFWAGQDGIVMTTELPGLNEQDVKLTVKVRCCLFAAPIRNPKAAPTLSGIAASVLKEHSCDRSNFRSGSILTTSMAARRMKRTWYPGSGRRTECTHGPIEARACQGRRRPQARRRGPTGRSIH